MNFEEKYNLLTQLVIIANNMKDEYSSFMSLKKLIEEEVTPVNLQCDARQLHKAAKHFTELKIEYLKLKNKLDKASGPSDVWALEALDKMVGNIK